MHKRYVQFYTHVDCTLTELCTHTYFLSNIIILFSGGEAVKSQHKRTPSADSNASSSEESDQPLSFVGRFKGEGGGGGGVVHPRALREMNTWTPQGM